MISVGSTRRGSGGRGDADLIQACLQGDRFAWDELVDRYSRLVYSVPRRCGLSESDSDDVMQNVFLTLYRKLETLRDTERLAGWLLTTAHRESWRVGRKNRLTLDPEMEPIPDDEEVSIGEDQQLVRQALRLLGGRCEQLLVALFRATGQPNYEAIASQLDMPVGSIGPTRARCFKKLEKILLDMGYQPVFEEEEESELKNNLAS